MSQRGCLVCGLALCTLLKAGGFSIICQAGRPWICRTSKPEQMGRKKGAPPPEIPGGRRGALTWAIRSGWHPRAGLNSLTGGQIAVGQCHPVSATCCREVDCRCRNAGATWREPAGVIHPIIVLGRPTCLVLSVRVCLASSSQLGRPPRTGKSKR